MKKLQRSYGKKILIYVYMVSLSPIGITVHLPENISVDYNHSDLVYLEYEDGTMLELNQSSDEMKVLAKSRVCVVGCGGLGGYIIEMLGRIGVGNITAIDGDIFDLFWIKSYR